MCSRNKLLAMEKIFCPGQNVFCLGQYFFVWDKIDFAWDKIYFVLADGMGISTQIFWPAALDFAWCSGSAFPKDARGPGFNPRPNH